MKRPLMHPMLANETSQSIHVFSLKGDDHLLRKLAHPGESEGYALLPAAIALENGGNRVPRDMRLAGVHQHTALLERLTKCRRHRDALNPHRVGEREVEETTIRCRVVVLTPPGNPEVFHLNLASTLGDTATVDGYTTPSIKRAQQCGTRSRGSPEPRGHREVAPQYRAYLLLQLRSSQRGPDQLPVPA